jgi:hypothetical protein
MTGQNTAVVSIASAGDEGCLGLVILHHPKEM